MAYNPVCVIDEGRIHITRDVLCGTFHMEVIGMPIASYHLDSLEKAVNVGTSIAAELKYCNYNLAAYISLNS